MNNRYFHLLLLFGITIANNLNATGANQFPLHEAVRDGKVENLEYLLKNGFNVDEVNQDGFTPLHFVVGAYSIREDIIEVLYRYGADFNKKARCLTPLHIASWKGDKDIVLFLCQRGSNINKITKRGTPLHVACGEGHKDIVEVFCNLGAYCQKNKEDFQTPLHWAVARNRLQIIPYLVFFYGKQILPMQTINGETALDIANMFRFSETVQLLSDENRLDQEVERVRDEQLAKGMNRNCQRLNPLAYLAGREIGKSALQIKLEEQIS